jgi:hypothetical protein
VAATLLSNTDLALRLQLLEGVRDGLKSLGRNVVTKPKNWDEAFAALDAAKDAKLSDVTAQIGQLFGDAKAAGASKGEGLEPVRHGRPGAAADSRQRARPDAAFTVGPPN